MRWKRGVLVTAAPDVLYLEDADGDGKADARTVVLTGFARHQPAAQRQQPGLRPRQLDPAGPLGRRRRDHLPGAVRRPRRAAAFPGSPAGRPSMPEPRRALPAGSAAQSRRDRADSQYGNTFDAWGRYFTLENNDHARHEVIAARYLERNPHLPCLAERDGRHLRSRRRRHACFRSRQPAVRAADRSRAVHLGLQPHDVHRRRVPGSTRAASFVAEPVHNLVHRDVIDGAGATFVARRARGDGREFLASTDLVPPGEPLRRARRRALRHRLLPSAHRAPGVDGQRPPQEPRAVRSTGRDRGRIYRVVPTAPRTRAAAAPGRGDRRGSVTALSHRNLWWRRTAQRLLVDRRRRDAAPALERSRARRLGARAPARAVDARRPRPCSTTALVVLALGDPEAGVRENALAPRRAAPGRVARAPGGGAGARGRRAGCPRAVPVAGHAGSPGLARVEGGAAVAVLRACRRPLDAGGGAFRRARPRGDVPARGAAARQRRAGPAVRGACGVFHAGRIGCGRHARTGSRGRTRRGGGARHGARRLVAGGRARRRRAGPARRRRRCARHEPRRSADPGAGTRPWRATRGVGPARDGDTR